MVVAFKNSFRNLCNILTKYVLVCFGYSDVISGTYVLLSSNLL
jgi:hypothetical protein